MKAPVSPQQPLGLPVKLNTKLPLQPLVLHFCNGPCQRFVHRVEGNFAERPCLPILVGVLGSDLHPKQVSDKSAFSRLDERCNLIETWKPADALKTNQEIL